MKPALHLVPMCLAVALVLGACASRPTRTVAVEDRSIRPAAPAARPAANGSGSASGSPPAVAAPAPAAESPSNAGRPGYYTVRPGDTLVRIGLDHGQNWRDIARWNQIENPNLIEVGQVLRVAPEPALSRTPPARGEPRTDGRVDPRQEPRVPPRAEAPGREGMRDGGRDGTREVAVDDAARETPREAAAEVAWAWPASGAVFQGFDEQRNKGLKIAGKAGDAVTAAADGRVVYAGSALRGYGNLVIIKHNATFLTAYAHNQTLLVKEDQAVRRGQKIAEMGSSDADRVQLHFEIRRDGKPVDPARLLPAR